MLTCSVHLSLGLPDLPPGRGLSRFAVPWSPKEELCWLGKQGHVGLGCGKGFKPVWDEDTNVLGWKVCL